jgi:hypothetical protein
MEDNKFKTIRVIKVGCDTIRFPCNGIKTIDALLQRETNPKLTQRLSTRVEHDWMRHWTTEISWDCLLKMVSEEMAFLLKERVLGMSVLDVNQPITFGRNTAFDMTLLPEGKRDKGFLRVPVGNPRPYFTGKYGCKKLKFDNANIKYYRIHGGDEYPDALATFASGENKKWQEQTKKLIKEIRNEGWTEDIPPVPQHQYDITSLKWCSHNEHDRGENFVGHWEGLYRIPLMHSQHGMNAYHYRQAKCLLMTDWVQDNFQDDFLKILIEYGRSKYDQKN